MHRQVMVWKRSQREGGYTYVVQVWVDLTSGEVIIRNYCVGPRGGTETIGHLGLNFEEWNAIQAAVHQAVTEDEKNEAELKSMADSGNPTAIGYMES